jgi:hypothetical protein
MASIPVPIDQHGEGSQDNGDASARLNGHAALPTFGLLADQLCHQWLSNGCDHQKAN